MEMTNRILAMTAAGILTLGGCVEEGGKEGPEMRFEIAYPGVSRVTETSFEEGDCVGVFVKEEEKPLEVSGNTVNNEAVAFEGNEWTPRRALYWEEGTYDVVGYYPYQERVESVEDLRFAVRLDQSAEGTDGGPGGYEASDFLWAVRENVRAEDGAVELRFAHRMSKLVVRLVPTEDYEGEAYCPNYRDTKGISIYEAMKAYGLDPEKIGEAAWPEGSIRAFLEIHIEQGPVLDAEGVELGLVEGIVGIQRYAVSVLGRADHAGTTPMEMRHDAAEAAAKVMARIPDWAREEGEGTVATVGYIHTVPGGMNIVAERVEFTVDIRSMDNGHICMIADNMREALEQETKEIG